MAVCKEAEGIAVVFLGEYPSLFCQLVEYFLGVCVVWRERTGGGEEREEGEEDGWRRGERRGREAR